MTSDRTSAFMRPLWRRVAVVAVCVAWAGVELWHGETVWAILAMVLAGYGVWAFFIAFDPAGDPAGDKEG